MDFDKVVKKRASIRSFSNKKIDDGEIIQALEAANSAPSPGNMQVLTFILVDDAEKMRKIADACQQDFVARAQKLVVICSDNKKIDDMYDIRADKYLKQHAGAVVENFLLKITDLGLASCWVGAFDDQTVKDTLLIPDEINIEAILPVAYQSKTDSTQQKRKPSLFNILYFNEYKNKFQKPHKLIAGH